MKKCSRCKVEKQDEEFCWKCKAKGWRNAYCKPCQKLCSQEHYNRPGKKDLVLARNAIRREERQKELFVYLLSHPCMTCGESDPVLLDFDHRNPEEKEACVARMFNRCLDYEASWKEIEKCDVLCVKCHRKRTAIQNGRQAKVDKWLKEFSRPGSSDSRASA